MNITNSTNNTLITGTAGNDSIINRGDNVTINPGAGDDSVFNGNFLGFLGIEGKNLLVQYKPGDGNDFIQGFNSDSTLSIAGSYYATTSKGNDIIVYVGEEKITLRGSALSPTGRNIVGSKHGTLVTNSYSFRNEHDNVVIVGNEVDNGITNHKRNVMLEGGKGNDLIENNGGNATLIGDKGNDTINLNGKNNLILYNAGDGNDLILGFNDTTTLDIGEENSALVRRSGEDLFITLGDSEITLRGAANLSKINIQGLPDEILNTLNTADNVSIVSGRYDGSIRNEGSNVTILAQGGNDSVWNNGNNVMLNSGEGDDLITGFNATSTLRLDDSNDIYSRTESGDDVIINYAGQNITLKGAAQLDKLNIGGVTKLNVNNTGNSIEIIGQHLDDSIINSGKLVTIGTNAGKDTISNSGLRVIIDGGADSDTISNSGSFVSIDGGDDNDRISVSGGYRNTISGGAGDDSIYISPTERDALIQYNAGDGSDLIEGFNSTSTLKIGDGKSTYARTDSGDDVIITVKDGGQITLKGAASLPAINIFGIDEDAVGKNIFNSEEDTIIRGGVGNDSIKNTGSNSTVLGDDTIINGESDSYKDSSRVLIDGGEGNDLIKIENSGLTAEETISGGKGNDTINLNGKNNVVVYKAGDGDDFISDFNKTATLSIASSSYSTLIQSSISFMSKAAWLRPTATRKFLSSERLWRIR